MPPAPPDDDRGRPAWGAPSGTAASASDTDSVRQAADRTPDAALVDLLLELRPDLPLPIAESLIREALHGTADAILDVEWAHTRQRLYPDALAAAHARHTLPYAARRGREIADARRPRPGDHHGRVACRCLVHASQLEEVA